MKAVTCLALAGVAASMLAGPPAAAAESYDNCTGFIDSVPATISTQGVWCLRKDLATAVTNGVAIEVATNNVTIDCNDFKLGGLAAGMATSTTGIYSKDRLNVRVTHCNIRGFLTGISLLNGSGHVVEDNNVNDSRYLGIRADGESRIARNRVIATGGSTLAYYSRSAATGIFTAGDTDVVGNSVDGVAPVGDAIGDAKPSGITVLSNYAGSIRDNRIRGLVRKGAGTSAGITLLDSGRVTIADNFLVGQGEGTAISCENPQGITLGNVDIGFETDVTGCTVRQHGHF